MKRSLKSYKGEHDGVKMGFEMLWLCNKPLGTRKCKGSYKVRQEIIQWWGVEREEHFTQILSFKCHNEELERWTNG